MRSKGSLGVSFEFHKGAVLKQSQRKRRGGWGRFLLFSQIILQPCEYRYACSTRQHVCKYSRIFIYSLHNTTFSIAYGRNSFVPNYRLLFCIVLDVRPRCDRAPIELGRSGLFVRVYTYENAYKV